MGGFLFPEGTICFYETLKKNRSEFIWCSCVNSTGSSNKPVISKLTESSVSAFEVNCVWCFLCDQTGSPTNLRAEF